MYKKSQAFQVKRKIHGTLQRHRYNKNQVWKSQFTWANNLDMKQILGKVFQICPHKSGQLDTSVSKQDFIQPPWGTPENHLVKKVYP